MFIDNCHILSLLPWLMMRGSFMIKWSKPESSVNRLNLFKVLIPSSTSFLEGCAICLSGSSSSFSSSPSVATSAILFRKIQKQSLRQTMFKICWFQVAIVLPGTMNWMATSLLGPLLSGSFSVSYFVFKVSLLRFFFVAILNTRHMRLTLMH